MNQTTEPPRVLVYFDNGRAPDREVGRVGPWQADEFAPYGYGAACGYVRLFFSVNRPEHRVVRTVRKSVSYAIGFDAVHAWRSRADLNSADAVWTHTEHEFLAVALLKRLGIVKTTKLLGQSVWLWDEWPAMTWPKKRLYRWLLGAVDLHTTLSVTNASTGREVLQQDVVFVPYGGEEVDLAGTSIQVDASVIRVIAPGSDRHRDWATLATVAQQAPDISVTFVSGRRRARRAAARAGGHVTVRRASSRAEMMAMYADADVVVVPLVPNGHASGVTVVFEGIGCGRPVAATDVGGLGSYFPEMVSWAEVGDPVSLEAAIRSAAADSRNEDLLATRRAELRERGLTIDDYGRRHVILTQYLLGIRADLSAATEFTTITRTTLEAPTS